MNAKENYPGTAEPQQQDLNEPMSTLKQKARAVQETAQQWQRQATEATRKAARATDDYVHENPWYAIGCVALGCFLFGFFVGRSRP